MSNVSSPRRRRNVLRADPPCPDLRQLCRGTYHLDHDPAADPGDDDPWMQTLVGKFGVVYPFGPDRLAVEVIDGRVARRLAEVLGDAPPYTSGGDCTTYLFHFGLLAAVAAVIRPPRVRRRRSLSEEARERLAANREGTRFDPRCHSTPEA